MVVQAMPTEILLPRPARTCPKAGTGRAGPFQRSWSSGGESAAVPLGWGLEPRDKVTAQGRGGGKHLLQSWRQQDAEKPRKIIKPTNEP